MKINENRQPNGIFLSKAGDHIVLEIDSFGGVRPYPSVRVGTVTNTIGEGAIRDSKNTELNIVGSQSEVKQYAVNLVILVGAAFTFMTLQELFAYDDGLAAYGSYPQNQAYKGLSTDTPKA